MQREEVLNKSFLGRVDWVPFPVKISFSENPKNAMILVKIENFYWFLLFPFLLFKAARNASTAARKFMGWSMDGGGIYILRDL